MFLTENRDFLGNMGKPKGGRGKQAPYESKLVRIPEPLLDDVERLKDEFYGNAIAEDAITSGGGEAGRPPALVDALGIAQDILKSKKSARVSLERFLKALYGQDVTL